MKFKKINESNIKTDKLNEGSYDFGEYKKQAETVETKIANIIGAYSRNMYIPNNSSGYMLTRQDKDYRFNKQNFYLHPFGYSLTKDDEIAMKNNIKSAGGKYIVSSYGNIHFYIDETPFITARDNEQAEIDNDFNLRKSEYEDKLNTEDIEKYKPTDKILTKLQDYRSRGSKVNVKAIKNIDKLLTYYYAACMMDWKDLKYSCEETIPTEYKDIRNAISFRCDSQDSLVDTRDKDTQSISTQFNRITAFLHDQNINYTFKKRKPTYTELELDRRDGRCWTIGYTLELSNGTSIDFANHTNEGGGTYGYSVNGGNRVGKKEAEDRIIQIIKNSLSTNESLSGGIEVNESIKTFGAMNKSLKEDFNDIDTETLEGPKEGPEAGLTSLLTAAIKDEWTAIQTYNDLSVSARAENYEDIAKVIDEINTEENKHVGQLQELLKLISPNTEAIEVGSEEGKEQLNQDDELNLDGID